jgi:hypothetical protein
MVAEAAGVIDVAPAPPSPAAIIARHEALVTDPPRARRKFDWKWP